MKKRENENLHITGEIPKKMTEYLKQIDWEKKL